MSRPEQDRSPRFTQKRRQAERFGAELMLPRRLSDAKCPGFPFGAGKKRSELSAFSILRLTLSV